MSFCSFRGLRLWNVIFSFSWTKVMECHFVYSARLKVIECHLVRSAVLRL